jgi:hypothetical protein
MSVYIAVSIFLPPTVSCAKTRVSSPVIQVSHATSVDHTHVPIGLVSGNAKMLLTMCVRVFTQLDTELTKGVLLVL